MCTTLVLLSECYFRVTSSSYNIVSIPCIQSIPYAAQAHSSFDPLVSSSDVQPRTRRVEAARGYMHLPRLLQCSSILRSSSSTTRATTSRRENRTSVAIETYERALLDPNLLDFGEDDPLKAMFVVSVVRVAHSLEAFTSGLDALESRQC